MIQPTNNQPNTPELRDPRILTPVTEAAQPQLLKVLDALDGRAWEKTVRHFLYGVTHKLFPNDLHMVSWLIQTIGKEKACRLVEAFAVHPCFYCHEGRNPCGDCGGHGRSATGGVCESCLGLGRAFCDFCNGTGWVAIDFVPPGLRLKVVIVRVRHAMTWAKALLDEPLPSIDSADLTSVRNSCARLLWALNRTMGVLDNGVIAVRGVVPAELTDSPAANQVLLTCVHAAGPLDQRMRQVLEVLAETSRRLAANEMDAELQKAAARAADFYQHLASGSFARTQLEHPHIHQLAHEAPQADQEAGDGARPRHRDPKARISAK